ncbi:MAG: hypothetical protein ACC642_04120, partial [Pseudomonadales bacterium]
MSLDLRMHRPLSLSLRLTLLFGITAAGIFIVFGWMISRSTETHFAAEDSSELEIIAAAVMNALSEVEPEGDIARLKHRFDDLLVGHHSASLSIFEQAQGEIYASPGPDLSAIIEAFNGDVKDRTVRRWEDSNHNYRVLVRTLDEDQPSGRRYTITVAVPVDLQIRFLDAFRRTLWLMIVTSIAFMSLMGWVAARRGHAPLRQIVDRIRQISVNKLDNRLSPETLPSELTDLAVS